MGLCFVESVRVVLWRSFAQTGLLDVCEHLAEAADVRYSSLPEEAGMRLGS